MQQSEEPIIPLSSLVSPSLFSPLTILPLELLGAINLARAALSCVYPMSCKPNLLLSLSPSPPFPTIISAAYLTPFVAAHILSPPLSRPSLSPPLRLSSLNRTDRLGRTVGPFSLLRAEPYLGVRHTSARSRPVKPWVLSSFHPSSRSRSVGRLPCLSLSLVNPFWDEACA